MIKQVTNVLVFWFTLMFGASVLAAQASPQEVLEKITNEMIVALVKDQDKIQSDPNFIYQLVDTVLVPHVDFEEMSRRVLGVHWRNASEQQRKEFVNEFSQLVVRTYGSAFREYSDQSVNFLDTIQRGGGEYVDSRAQIIQPGKPPVSILFSMIDVDNDWKVYDFSVENISLVSSFRSQFFPIIRQNGIDGLISEIKDKNSSNA